MMTPEELFECVSTALVAFSKKTHRKTRCVLYRAGSGAFSVGVFIGNVGHAFDVEQVRGSFVTQNFCDFSICRVARKFIFQKLRETQG